MENKLKKIATWQDVLNKAKRLVDEGRVSISYITSDLIGGTCEGDHGHYEPILAFDEDNMKISDSTCNCFVPGMLVTMADGTMKPIEEVGVGDVVITHLGNAKPVLKEFKREYVGEVIVVGFGGKNIYCTPEHPFYIVEDKELKWVKASDLKVGTLLTHPTNDGYEYFAISELKTSDYEGFVYNIEVANDNSYVVNNVNVHNCQWGKWQWERMPGPKVNNPRGLGGYGGLRGRKCFLPDTMVSLADGSYKKISEIEIGDKVLCLNGVGNVIAVYPAEYDGDVVTTTCYGSNYSVTSTADHNFLFNNEWENRVKGFSSKKRSSHAHNKQLSNSRIFADKNNWMGKKKASELSVGQYLLKTKVSDVEEFSIAIDDSLVASEIRKLEIDHYEGMVYNIEVDNGNTYAVEDILVHNCAHETALYNLFMSVYQGGFEKQKVGMDTFEIAERIARATDEDGVVILDNEDCRGLTLVGTDFVGGSFVDTIFMDCDLSESDFSMSECFYTNFRGSNLSFVNFNDASLIGVDFTNCDLTGASFVGAFISEDSVIDEDELWRFEDCVQI